MPGLHLATMVRAQIGPRVEALWYEIETAARLPISVGYSAEVGAPSAAAICDENSACIVFPDPTRVSDYTVAHELLHLKRSWVGGVPSLHPVNPGGENNRYAGWFESVLEHFAISALEPNYVDNSQDQWNSFPSPFSNYPWPEYAVDVRRGKTLVSWLSMQMTSLPGPIEHARKCVEAEGLTQVANTLLERVIRFRSNKPKQAAALLKAIGIHRRNFRLRTIDIRTRRASFTPVPSLTA